LPWVRVFTEEYQGRHGYTRRFLAATYSVSVMPLRMTVHIPCSTSSKHG
jgi:hypothetical protein